MGKTFPNNQGQQLRWNCRDRENSTKPKTMPADFRFFVAAVYPGLSQRISVPYGADLTSWGTKNGEECLVTSQGVMWIPWNNVSSDYSYKRSCLETKFSVEVKVRVSGLLRSQNPWCILKYKLVSCSQKKNFSPHPETSCGPTQLFFWQKMSSWS